MDLGLIWDYLFNNHHRLHRLSSHLVKFNDYCDGKNAGWVVNNPKSHSTFATNQLCARAGQPYGVSLLQSDRALHSDGPTIGVRLCCCNLESLNHF